MALAIRVENVSKAYQIGEIGTGTLAWDIQRWYARMRGRDDPFTVVGEANDRTIRGEGSVVWSLKDINFEIEEGGAVGIIGRNGAGKSTLLKLLSRVTSPTTGKIQLKGRIASLLEVGTGFHPELTGRENIYLNGAILGMRKKEVTRKFDEIVEFSGVERYIDTPVKRYSSGMYVRLAFAVAAHLESEILIIDEVLAVGDSEFQKKCLNKMDKVHVNEGRTVLYVSHDLQSVATLTNRALLLKNGIVLKSGETKSVIKYYTDSTKSTSLVYESAQTDDKPYIARVAMQTMYANNVHLFGHPLQINFRLYTPAPIKNACFSFQIIDSRERNYVHLWVFDAEMAYCRERGFYELQCSIPSLKLYMGKYYLRCYFTEPPGGRIFEIIENICPFEVVMYETKRKEFQWVPDTCAYIENGSWTTAKID